MFAISFVFSMVTLKLFCLHSPATSLPKQISEARAVAYEDSFLLVGGRHIFYAGVYEENADIYKFELDAGTAKTVATELNSDGTLSVYSPPSFIHGSWKKLPQKTRTSRYTGR